MVVKAIPARPGTIPFRQADGTTIDVQLVGDEHYHYYLAPDGTPLVECDGMLVSRPNPRPDMAPAKGPGLFINASFPTLGEQRSIVILVEYSDVKFRLADPADYFQRMLNQPGFSDYGATGSARDYYLDASMGRFDPRFDVYGPVTLPHDMAWYGANSGGSDGMNARMMVVDACNILDPKVDFSQYDRDHDGTIDNVFLFYAGLGEATGGGADTVWPHSADVIGNYSYDGKTLKTYGCTNEWVMDDATSGHPDAIGTFCHEFGHVLGLPDLYATTYPTPAPFTPGAWALMDRGAYNNGGRTPPALDLFSRYALGWWDPVVISSPVDARLQPLAASGEGYMVATSDPNTYYLIENRQKIGWDRYVPGHGMLLWRVQYDVGVWLSHSVNNDARHQYVDILEADGTQTETTRAGDTFPGEAGVTYISASTTPGFGDGLSQMTISDIEESPAGLITFKALGGADPAPAVEALAATDVTPCSFVAHWQPLEGAIDYRLTVYGSLDQSGRGCPSPQYNADDAQPMVVVNGYSAYITGNVTECEVTSLQGDRTYYYTVTAITPTSTGEPSQLIEVQTPASELRYRQPRLSAPSQVSDCQFTATWDPVDDADGYLLTVQRRNVMDAEVMTESFDNKSSVWFTNSSAYYAAEAYIGEEAPSLRLNAGGYVVTPVVERGTMRDLSFWHRGRYADSAGISVDVYAHGCWRTVRILPVETERGGASVRVGGFPDDTDAVRIRLVDSAEAASIFVDDLTAVYGGAEQLTPLPEYTAMPVGDVTSYTVTDLQPGTEYFYTVRAVKGAVCSLESAPEYVHTLGEAGVGVIFTDCDTDAPVEYYDLRGVRIAHPSPGSLYIVRQGSKVTKHIAR